MVRRGAGSGRSHAWRATTSVPHTISQHADGASPTAICSAAGWEGPKKMEKEGPPFLTNERQPAPGAEPYPHPGNHPIHHTSPNQYGYEEGHAGGIYQNMPGAPYELYSHSSPAAMDVQWHEAERSAHEGGWSGGGNQHWTWLVPTGLGCAIAAMAPWSQTTDPDLPESTRRDIGVPLIGSTFDRASWSLADMGARSDPASVTKRNSQEFSKYHPGGDMRHHIAYHQMWRKPV